MLHGTYISHCWEDAINLNGTSSMLVSKLSLPLRTFNQRVNEISVKLQLNNPNTLHWSLFLLTEEAILGYCTVSYCRSAALEALFFQPPTQVASLSLWNLLVFGQQLHRPLSGEHHHPLGADEASLPLLSAQTAHFPLAVRPTLGNAVQQQHIGQHRWGHRSGVGKTTHCRCAVFTMSYGTAFRCFYAPQQHFLSKNIIHVFVAQVCG